MQRTCIATCLALGAYGGLYSLAAGCSPQNTVTASDLNATVNRADAVGAFADGFVNLLLTDNNANDFAAFTSAQVTPTPVPMDVIKTIPWSVQRQPVQFANVDSWSVIVGAFVKPISKPPQLRFYQVAVDVIQGRPRASSTPGIVNGPDIGFDVELGYQKDITQGSTSYKTVADFLNSWLVRADDHHPASGDIARYSTSPQIRPFDDAPFSRISIDAIKAEKDIPETAPNGFTSRIYVTGQGIDDSTNQTFSYPLVLTRQSDKWFISDIDLAPKLNGRITQPKTTPTSQSPSDTPTG